MAIRLTINDQIYEAREGQTILDVARANKITVPVLCYHKDLSPVGSCRMCVVEVEKWRGQAAACTTQIAEGMVIRTETPAVVESRRTILSLLLANYHDSGYAPPNPNNELIYWAKRYGVAVPKTKPRYKVNGDPSPVVWVDLNKCILCTRCVRACAEVQGRFVWGVGGRGHEAHIIAGANTTMIEARCESCGACAAYCPTGALGDKMSVGAGLPDKKVTTTCTYCGVGCQFDLNVKDDRIIRVTSNPRAPVNGMHLCVKGRYGYDFVHHPDRLKRPRVRKYLLEEQQISNFKPQMPNEWVEVDWDTALDITARKLREARDNYGADSVGVLTSAKCLNEENYLMNKFARQVIGTNNIDHCARL